MVDDHDRQIQEAKRTINDYIQKARPDFAKRISAFAWIDNPEENEPGFHRLVFYIGMQQHSIKFFQAELEDATRTPEGDLSLKKRVDAFFRMLEQ